MNLFKNTRVGVRLLACSALLCAGTLAFGQIWGQQPFAAMNDPSLIAFYPLSYQYNNAQRVLANPANPQATQNQNNPVMYDYSGTYTSSVVNQGQGDVTVYTMSAPNDNNAEYLGLASSSNPYSAVYGSYPSFARFGTGGFVQINYLPKPSPLTVTVSAWAAVSGQMTGGFSRIVEWGTYNNGVYVGGNPSNTKYQVIVNNGNSAGNYGNCEGGTIDTNWHLVTATFDGSNANLYVDGALVAGPCAFSATPQLVGNSPQPQVDYTARIGCYNDSQNKGFGGYTPLACSSVSGAWGGGTNGFIAGVRFYTRVVSPAEISAIYYAEYQGFILR